jgi:hypothetical protein
MSENVEHGAGTSTERSPEEIEREIAGTRASIDETVGELGQRLSPRQLAEDARDYVRETASRSASNAWTRVSGLSREHAVPLVLIGSGLAWYMMSGREGHTYARRFYGYGEDDADYGKYGQGRFGEAGYGEAFSGRESGYGSSAYGEPGEHDRGRDAGEHGRLGEMASRTTEAAREATHRAREATHRVRERTAEATHRVRERTAEMGHRAQDRVQSGLHRARHELDHVRHEQPLLLGIASLALGALVGGIVPITRREEAVLGDVADRALDAVAEAGRQTAEQVRQTASKAAEPQRSGGGQQGEEQEGTGQQRESGRQQTAGQPGELGRQPSQQGTRPGEPGRQQGGGSRGAGGDGGTAPPSSGPKL